MREPPETRATLLRYRATSELADQGAFSIIIQVGNRVPETGMYAASSAPSMSVYNVALETSTAFRRYGEGLA